LEVEYLTQDDNVLQSRYFGIYATIIHTWNFYSIPVKNTINSCLK